VKIKEVRNRLKKAYREQNKVYNQWKDKLVGPVPEFLHTPELLNSELIHSIVESVDYLLAQAERDEKTKAKQAEPFRASIGGMAATDVTEASVTLPEKDLGGG